MQNIVMNMLEKFHDDRSRNDGALVDRKCENKNPQQEQRRVCVKPRKQYHDVTLCEEVTGGKEGGPAWRMAGTVSFDDWQDVLSRNVVASVKTRYARPAADDIRSLILGRVAASQRTTIVKIGRQNQQQLAWRPADVLGRDLMPETWRFGATSVSVTELTHAHSRVRVLAFI